MERVGGRWEKMEGYCSTGQSPHWAVVPMEEEEYMCTYIYVYMCVCVCVCVCACLYVCVNMYVCICVCINVWMQ